MTIKQYYKLKPFEETLKTALYSDYFRNLTQKARNEMDEVYVDIFKESSSLNVGCGNCQLKSLKKLAKPYFVMKEKMEKKKEDINDKPENIEHGNEERTEGES